MGARFGSYELRGRLGVGGMAEVLEAVDVRSGRVVALKRILPHLVGDARFAEMFLREAQLSLALAHPNVVRVFEHGTVDGVHYLAMEQVAGCSLSALLKSLAAAGPPPPGVGAFVTREVCRALAYAHGCGPIPLLHRDVSSSNVMLSLAGEVKLVDFGIAKALADFEERTQTGHRKGNARYLAPERMASGPYDHRSDLFAAGALLYEALVGRPWRNDPTRAPAPSTLNPQVPAELDAICARALAPRPEDRFAHADEMADALTAAVERLQWDARALAPLVQRVAPPVDAPPSSTTLTAPDARPRRRSPSRRILIAACALAATGVVLWWSWPVRSTIENPRAAPPPPTVVHRAAPDLGVVAVAPPPMIETKVSHALKPKRQPGRVAPKTAPPPAHAADEDFLPDPYAPRSR